MQDGNFPTQVNDGGDFFNNGGAELGMWANTGNKKTAAWSNFGTGGLNASGSARSLQVGDVFKITVAATRAYGQIGFSLNAGGTQGSSYDNRTSGSRLYFNTDNYNAWYVNNSSGNSSLQYVPLQDTYKDYAFTVRITSLTTADVYLTVDGTDYRAYNLTMNGSAGANISAVSIYGSDMWDGTSNDNAYWKQTSTIENTGVVQLGYYMTNGSFTPGTITDGLAANSTSTASTNAVFVGGDAGSYVVLNQANTYGGATTVNSNATALAANSSAFGTNGTVTVTSGGRIQMSNNISVARAITLNGTGISESGAVQSINGANTWQGSITLGSTASLGAASGAQLTVSNVSAGANQLAIVGAGTVTIAGNVSSSGANQFFKTNTGTAILSGANTFAGTKFIREGIVVLSNNSAMGGAGDIFLGATNGSAAATLMLGENITNSTLIDVNGGGTGIRTLSYQTASGTGAQLGNIKLVNSSLAFNVTNGGTALFGGGLEATTGGSDQNRLALDGGGTLIVTNNGTGISSSDRYQVRIGNGTMIIGSGTIVARTNVGGTAIGHALDLGVDLNGNIVNAASRLFASNNVTVSNSIYVSTTNSQARVVGQQDMASASTATYSGRIDLANATLTTQAGTNSLVTISGPIADWSGTNGLTKTGVGTVTLSASNNFNGSTTVSEGTLRLNATGGFAAGSTTNVAVSSGATLLISQGNQVNDTAAVTLSGGTIAKGSGAINETMGALTLSTTSYLDFGSGTGNFTFASYNPGSSQLTFQNFNLGNSLTITNGSFTNSQFNFGGFGYSLSSVPTGGFTITAIPEPSSVFAAVGLSGLMLWPARRRLGAMLGRK